MTSIDSVPGAKLTMHSGGTMVFRLPRGTIRMRVRMTQRFASDGKHARQTTGGTIIGGSGSYRAAQGTVTRAGSVLDNRTSLREVELVYRLTLELRV